MWLLEHPSKATATMHFNASCTHSFCTNFQCKYEIHIYCELFSASIVGKKSRKSDQMYANAVSVYGVEPSYAVPVDANLISNLLFHWYFVWLPDDCEIVHRVHCPYRNAYGFFSLIVGYLTYTKVYALCLFRFSHSAYLFRFKFWFISTIINK